jgi:hypothetical protein
MTQAQIIGLGILLLFGFAYNSAVVWYQRHGDDKFTALPVIVGLMVTLAVLYLDSLGGVYGVEFWIMLTIAHLAASGSGMTLGSWQRAR